MPRVVLELIVFEPRGLWLTGATVHFTTYYCTYLGIFCICVCRRTMLSIILVKCKHSPRNETQGTHKTIGYIFPQSHSSLQQRHA